MARKSWWARARDRGLEMLLEPSTWKGIGVLLAGMGVIKQSEAQVVGQVVDVITGGLPPMSLVATGATLFGATEVIRKERK